MSSTNLYNLSSAKNTFLDLDAVFSAGFVFVLVEIIAPGRSLGACGIGVSRGILTHLMDLGNHAASRRLAELDQMCAHLGPYQALEQLGQSTSTDTLSGVFSFKRGFEAQSQSNPANEDMSMYGHGTQGNGEEVPPSAQLVAASGSMSLGNGPVLQLGTSDISLDGEDRISWVFQPGMYTGSELADWEMFESQLNTTDLS
jgi:proline utilization trans-activator